MNIEKKKTILVQCSFIIPVEVPDTPEYLDYMYFDIEENHCPTTGIVGAEFSKLYEQYKDSSYCFACAFQGENKILEEEIEIKLCKLCGSYHCDPRNVNA